MLRNFGLAFAVWTLLLWASDLKGHPFELTCAFIAGAVVTRIRPTQHWIYRGEDQR